VLLVAGLKNMEVHRDLVDKPIPIDLLVRKGLRTKQVRPLHFYAA
jgi:hypothetical protein